MDRSARVTLAICLLGLIMLILPACYNPQVGVSESRTAIAVETGSRESGTGGPRAYAEARMMAKIEKWKDDDLKIVNVYFLTPDGSLIIPPIRCIGTPISTTEDLEPNTTSGTPFTAPIDGQPDILTTEVAGRDATWGDEVPANECLTVNGSYYRWPPQLLALTTSDALTFPPSTIRRDLETEIKLAQAQAIITRGGCVDPETLAEITCPTPTEGR